jgi:clan AA aspartic protease
MIRGSVGDDLDATIQLAVGGPYGRRPTVTAVIDTGFSGYLTLPPSIVQELALPWTAGGQALLADGSTTVFDVHIAIVQWYGADRRIEIETADTDPLVGVRLLHGYQLVIDVMTGGAMTISPLDDAGSSERVLNGS